MANEEHLAILKQGVGGWNEWRKANPEVKPDLRRADFSDTNLTRVDLKGVDLQDAILQNTNLRRANLRRANLIGCYFKGSNFTDADLVGADLSDANFRDACLIAAKLQRVQALGTDFREATLTGAYIQDWNINFDTKLDHVNCDYIYVTGYPNFVPQARPERLPLTGTFAPGEFAKLVQQSLDTIDLIFREGLDWKAFAYSFRQVEVLHENSHMEVRSIENKGDGVVVVKVAAAQGANKALIHSDFTQMYETVSKTMAAHYEARLLDKDTQLKDQSTYINQLLGIVNSSQEVQRVMAEQRSGDNYYGNIKAVNFTPHGTGMGGVYNDFSNTQDLAQAAAQIQALLSQLQQQGQSPEAAQQQVADGLAKQAKKDPTTLGKLVMWGQKLGDATVTDVVKSVVKLALRSAGVPLP